MPRKKRKGAQDEATQDAVLDLVGNSYVAKHILKGCEVAICKDTGAVLYICVSTCSGKQLTRLPSCSTLHDTHFILARLMHKQIFTKQEKDAIYLTLSVLQEHSNARCN